MPQCEAITKTGQRCKRTDPKNKYCFMHLRNLPSVVPNGNVLTQLTRNDSECEVKLKKVKKELSDLYDNLNKSKKKIMKEKKVNVNVYK